MTVRTLVRKELRTARRSRLVWGLALLLAFFTLRGVFSFIHPWPSPEGIAPDQERASVWLLTVWVNTIVGSLIGILLGCFAVTGEYESGRLKVLFGFPVSRRDYLLGTFLGRSTVVTGVMFAGIPFGVAAIAYRYGFFSPSGIATAALLTVLYGFTWFGIGFGISAVVSTRTQAFAGAFGVYLFFHSFWENLVMAPLFFLVSGRFPGDGDMAIHRAGQPLEWYHFVRRLNPIEAFGRTRPIIEGIHDAFAVGVLLAWFVVPVVLGYWRFRNRDLGGSSTSNGFMSLPNPLSRLTGRLRIVLPGGFGSRFRTRNPVLAIARKDFLTSYRSLLVRVLVPALAFFLTLGFLSLSIPSGVSLERTTMAALTNLVSQFYVPVVAILVGALAIANEFASGSLRTLLGLPVTRGQFVLGKSLGRGAVLTSAIALGYVVAPVALLSRIGGVAPIPFLQATIITILYGLAFLGIALGFSAVMSRNQALAGSFLLFAFFVALWRRLVVKSIYALLNGHVPADGALSPVTATGDVRWYHLLDRLNPVEAYKAVTLGVEVPDLAYWPAIVSLLGWTIVPVGLGYWRFRRRDVS